MQIQQNNQFIQFAKQLLEQQSQQSRESDEPKERSFDISQLIQFQPNNNNCQSPSSIKKEGQVLLPSDEPCNCSRSGCKKMYCECLAKGRLCSKYCRCCNCHNRTSNRLVLNVIEELDQNQERKRFRSRRFKDVCKVHFFKGCTCQKSMCLKKYCECFNSGKHCSLGCKCLNCENLSFNDIENIQYTPNQKKSSKYSSKLESAVTNTKSEQLEVVLERLEIEESEESEEQFEKMNTVVIMILGQLFI